MRKLFWIIFALVVAGAAAVLTGPYVYRHWRQEHLIHLANDFVAKGDQVNAALCLRRAVQSNPFDVRACRLYAALAERAASRNSVWWRQRVAELEPNVLQNQIDWAKAALAFGDLGAAQHAVDSVTGAGKKTAEYHKAAGALAWARNDFAQAETHYLEALKLEPDNATIRLNLAIAGLVVDYSAKAQAARATLEALRTNSLVHLEALRQLVQDASRNQFLSRAVAFAKELQADPECRFSDRILYLDALWEARRPELAERVQAAASIAATNSAQAYEMLNWRIHHGETRTGLAWAESLPAALRATMPLPMGMANGYALERNWGALDTMLKKQNWGDMEYLRHLMESVSLRSQGRTLEAAVEWRSALAGASQRIDSLNELVRRTVAWNWAAELNETLWAIVENFPIEKGAFLMLYDRLVEEGNTAALHNLLSRVSSYVDLPVELRNNFAVVSLLVYPRGQHGHDIAREIYEKEPGNPFVVSTYAYSLYLQQKGPEALRLFNGIKPENLEEPSIAAYYGIILAGTGDTTKARHYLERGLQAKLLPEEKALVTKAELGM
jgi:tetratricopeptide (TPR) repeat protein